MYSRSDSDLYCIEMYPSMFQQIVEVHDTPTAFVIQICRGNNGAHQAFMRAKINFAMKSSAKCDRSLCTYLKTGIFAFHPQRKKFVRITFSSG